MITASFITRSEFQVYLSTMLLLGLILVIIAATLAVECPPRDKVYPCSCDEDEGLVLITCEGFNSVLEIEPAVKNTIGYNVSFAFYRTNLFGMPSDFFKGHTSKKLHFEDCVVGCFGEPPFIGLEDSLEVLNLFAVIDDDFTKMDTFTLSHLRKLKYVYFLNNNVVEVGDHWFEGGPVSLEELNFGGNKIKKFGDKAFASLINLQQIYVNDNQIEALTRSVLPDRTKDLWVLEARSNQIEELPSDIFEGCSNLKIVNLSQNRLKTIPENVWGQIWRQLESVSLEGNDIICDDNLKWIYTEKLPRTFLGKCGPGNDLHNRPLSSLKLEDFQ